MGDDKEKITLYGSGKVTKKRLCDKIELITSIALKFALNNYYDSNNRLIFNGEVINDSNINSLLILLTKQCNLPPNINEFIFLLKKCGIDPALIINDKIRKKLNIAMRTTINSSPPDPIYPPNVLTNIQHNSEYYVKKLGSKQAVKKKRNKRKSPVKRQGNSEKASYNLRSHGRNWSIPEGNTHTDLQPAK